MPAQGPVTLERSDRRQLLEVVAVRLPRMSGFQDRVIDTSGSEIGIVADERPQIAEDDASPLPDGRTVAVLEV